jgi:hypothetical protein
MIPLPDADSKIINQQFCDVLKKINSWEKEISRGRMDEIITKALNNKNIAADCFYTDNQLLHISQEAIKEINQLIHEYKEFKQFLILSNLLKTFSNDEIEKIKRHVHELSPDLVSRIPLFIIWFSEEIKREFRESTGLLNMINNLDV